MVTGWREPINNSSSKAQPLKGHFTFNLLVERERARAYPLSQFVWVPSLLTRLLAHSNVFKAQFAGHTYGHMCVRERTCVCVCLNDRLHANKRTNEQTYTLNTWPCWPSTAHTEHNSKKINIQLIGSFGLNVRSSISNRSGNTKQQQKKNIYSNENLSIDQNIHLFVVLRSICSLLSLVYKRR